MSASARQANLAYLLDEDFDDQDTDEEAARRQVVSGLRVTVRLLEEAPVPKFAAIPST